MGLRISFFFFYTFDGRDLPKLHFHYMHPDFTVDFFYLKLKLKTWWNWWDTVYWRARHTNVSNLTISNQPSLIVDGSPAATAGMFYWASFYFWESLKYGKQIMSGQNKTLWMDPKADPEGMSCETTRRHSGLWSDLVSVHDHDLLCILQCKRTPTWSWYWFTQDPVIR